MAAPISPESSAACARSCPELDTATGIAVVHVRCSSRRQSDAECAAVLARRPWRVLARNDACVACDTPQSYRANLPVSSPNNGFVSQIRIAGVVLSLRFIAFKRENPHSRASEASDASDNRRTNQASHPIGGDRGREQRREPRSPGRHGRGSRNRQVGQGRSPRYVQFQGRRS